ncbi:MAG: ABC transporter permease [Trueperaceae bacterium]|nr:ABC transporter permease [Trueperaceae bacterium]
MTTYIVRRILSMAPVIFLISVMAFSLVLLLPGDAALAILGESGARDEARYQALRDQLGLDEPIPVRYLKWAGDALRGDLGTSIRTREPVAQAVMRRLSPTLHLTILALIIAVAVGLPLGVASAVRQRTWFDSVGTMFALGGLAIPNFWLGILLIYVFSIWLRWLPSSGFVPIWEDPLQSLRLLLMPSLALATGLMAIVLRQVRSAVLEVMREDYVTTARSKGLAERQVIDKHALRNALIPVITVIGLQLGRLFGGAVTIEIVFSIPGMGRLAVDSIFFRDFVMVQAIMLVLALAVLVASLVTDVFYAALDPRIRYD